MPRAANVEVAPPRFVPNVPSSPLRQGRLLRVHLSPNNDGKLQEPRHEGADGDGTIRVSYPPQTRSDTSLWQWQRAQV